VVNRHYKWVSLLMLVLLVMSGLPVSETALASAPSQDEDAHVKALALLSQMTPEERVGQLFLVTFNGISTDQDSNIYDLVVNHHIGGVLLKTANDNFIGPDGTIVAAHSLIQNLQSLTWNAGLSELTEPGPAILKDSAYIPLWIGIVQEGNSYPNDTILNGLTTLPSEMALGATWRPTLAYQVGDVLGKELSALGINLLFGPSLDVLDIPTSESADDLGTRAFGGDPFWVGEMGKAYIRGLHQGSKDSVLVIAKHFPGRGDSDRPPEEEVATVRKSLDQLKQIELAPFFAVTSLTTDPAAITDGVFVSHIRYQGFQGNIRATTRPVSFDQTALKTILSLPEFSDWRANYGILVSDDLGSPAVRKFFETSGAEYDPRQVARYALLAGNDLLYVDNFVAPNDPDSYTTILSTLAFLTQKYSEDQAFAETVDSSVERLLTLKFRMYPEFTLENVIAPVEGLANVGTGQQITFDTLRAAATLVSPSINELDSVLPRPPELRDKIVFLTDTRSASQCKTCAEQTILSTEAMKAAVLKLYGPTAGGEVQENRLTSFNFMDLDTLLTDPTRMPELELALTQADWIVVLLQKPETTIPSSMAFKNLLAERLELVRNKKVIVFSLGAPYYLDATDISRLTAYYALYGMTPDAVDIAARLLFQELEPTGALPVSVPSVGYDINDAVAPNPDQVISLYVDIQSPQLTETTTTPMPTPIPLFRIGDLLPMRTGEILDNNGNPVPDGTIARFIIAVGGDTAGAQQVETVTEQGIARTVYRIQSAGLVQIRVVADPAIISQVLQMDVTSEGAAITAIAPTPIPTGSVEAPIEELTETPSADHTGVDGVKINLGQWAWSFLLLVALGFGAFILGRQINLRWGFRWASLTVAGGWLAYLYSLFGLPGSEFIIVNLGTWGILGLVFVGAILGFGLGIIWRREQRLSAL